MNENASVKSRGFAASDSETFSRNQIARRRHKGSIEFSLPMIYNCESRVIDGSFWGESPKKYFMSKISYDAFREIRMLI